MQLTQLHKLDQSIVQKKLSVVPLLLETTSDIGVPLLLETTSDIGHKQWIRKEQYCVFASTDSDDILISLQSEWKHKFVRASTHSMETREYYFLELNPRL